MFTNPKPVARTPGDPRPKVLMFSGGFGTFWGRGMGRAGIDRGLYAGTFIPQCQPAQWLAGRPRHVETEHIHIVGSDFCRWSRVTKMHAASVGTVSSPKNRGCIPGTSQRFSSTPKRQNCLWGLSNLVFIEYR